MLLYYVRHGDPIYSPDSLTDLGSRQAEAVGRRIAMHGIDKIFSSTSNRAVLTATPLSQIAKKEIIQLDWCNEHHVWQELTATNGDDTFWIWGIDPTRSLLNSPEVFALGEKWYEHPGFEEKVGKGIQRINRETDAFMESLGYVHNRETKTYKALKPNNQRIALFAHQGFSGAFLSSLLDIPYPLFSTRFDLSHSCVTVIEFPDCEGNHIPTVLQHSNDSHLYHDGLPTKYNNRIYL